MTVTAFDFTAITGMSFSGESVPLSNEAYNSTVVRNIWLKDLFGATAVVKSSYVSLVQYTELVDKVRLGHDVGHVTSK